jgi:ABC-type glycerol-3-phosphate transport system substrate-binding protein
LYNIGMTKFQMILMGVFGVFLVGGIIIFATYKGNSQNAVTVVVWGTVSQTDFNNIIQKTSLYQSKEFNVQYVEKTEENFDTDFIESLASGDGPDIFMLPSDKILKHRNKIFAIPYNVFTQRQFKDSFIGGTEIYMAPEGTLALPISVDPLVMYWNRSVFTDAKLTEPPKYWDEFYNLANLISKKDGSLNILKSAVALGEFANISHAKEIILNLAMQAGTPVIEWRGNNIQSVFAEKFNEPTVPAEAAINFYTEFGNPSKPSYSWNRSLPNSTDYFLSGDLALYFGFASEIGNLQLKNPNLDFDVAAVPISREGGVNVSFANFNALAITKSSKNPNAAFSVISVLSEADGAAAFSKTLNLPPARRDLLGQKPVEAFQSVFYGSAIRAKSWLDPSPSDTDAIFKTMIESITSGRARTGEAVAKTQRELSSLLSPQ